MQKKSIYSSLKKNFIETCFFCHLKKSFHIESKLQKNVIKSLFRESWHFSMEYGLKTGKKRVDTNIEPCLKQ